jgi:hypothetical protein
MRVAAGAALEEHAAQASADRRHLLALRARTSKPNFHIPAIVIDHF